VAAVPDIDLSCIGVIHTLGPSGTNLEMAAHHWFRVAGREGEVRLHKTLESALPLMAVDGTHGLLACAVYPYLHSLVFENLARLRMVDSFVLPTYDMVLATRPETSEDEVVTVASHPAPQSLASSDYKIVLMTSNSQAAKECARGALDACVTTSKAADEHHLLVRRNFGPVPMVYTLHQAIASIAPALQHEAREAS
jgi:prephenate dehydratase